MRYVVLAAVAAASIAAPVLAQDRAPFTGPRVEGVVGWDRLSDGSGQDAGSSDGVVYGINGGYDVQAGRAILGIEGEVTGSTTDTRANSLLVAGDRLKVDAGRDLYVGARAGIAVSPNAMVYAKGGYTNARIETEYTAGNTKIEDGVNLDGFRVGGGLEYKLSGNTYAKAEYRYSHYGKVDGYDIDMDRHQVLGGVGIRF